MIRDRVNTQISFAGGACNTENMQELINKVGIVGVVAGSMFVFKGKFRAVLLSYERPKFIN